MRRVRLYGRAYCHLCEDMRSALERLSGELDFSVETVDVDGDAATASRYGERVPVLADEHGDEICHYVLDVSALRRRLAVK